MVFLSRELKYNEKKKGRIIDDIHLSGQFVYIIHFIQQYVQLCIHIQNGKSIKIELRDNDKITSILN